jgi:hypothetical protein
MGSINRNTSIEKEFSNYDLTEAIEIKESAKNTGDKPSQGFWQILCIKVTE